MSANELFKQQQQLSLEKNSIINKIADINLQLVEYFNSRLTAIKEVVKSSPELKDGYEDVLNMQLIEKIDSYWKKPLTKEEVLKLQVSYVTYNLNTLKVYLVTGDPFCGATWVFNTEDNIEEFLNSNTIRGKIYARYNDKV